MIRFLRRASFYIFPFGNGSNEVKRELRPVARHLQKTFPGTFHPVSGTLTETFAEEVRKLRDAFAPFRPALDAAFLDESIERRNGVRKRLLGLLMHTHNVSFSHLEFGVIRDELAKATGKKYPDDTDLIRIFDQRFTALSGLDSPKLNAVFNEVAHAAVVAQYDYDGLLERFQKKKVRAEHVLQHLYDLYHVLAGFKPTLRGTKLLRMIALAAKVEVPDVQTAVAQYAVILDVVQNTLSPVLLSDIIRLAVLETKVGLTIHDETVAFAEDFIAETDTKFRRALDSYRTEVAERALRSHIRMLFGDSQLPTIAGYNLETGALLAEAGLPRWRHYVSLQLVNAFLINHYLPHIAAPVTELADNVELHEEKTRDAYRESINTASSLLASIEKFAVDLQDGELSPLQAILQRINANDLAEKETVQFKREIEVIDRRADEIVQAGVRSMRVLGATTNSIVDDVRQRTPRLVVNYRHIREQHAELLHTLEQSVSTLTTFAQMMSRVTVDTDLLRTRLRGSSGSHP